MISSERPYLACSPDGLIYDATIIEVKCPYASRDRSVTSTTVPYVEHGQNGKFILKENHDYMHQVQGNMHITITTLCHLVTYTLVDLVIIDVTYDYIYVNRMLTRLESFFREHYLNDYLKIFFYLH